MSVFAVCVFCALPQTVFADDGKEIVGTVDTLIRGNTDYGPCVSEVDLGDVAADALRSVSGADIALVNGGDLSANLQAGECTWGEVQAVFMENKSLATAEITAAILWDWLEYSVSFAVLGEDEKIDQESSEFDGFLQISGFWFRYDLSAQPGDRVLYVELDDGTVLERGDETMFFTVCATEYMLSGGYGFQAVESIGLEQGLADALAEYMQETVITQPDGSRIRTIGSNDDPLISRTTVFVVALAACIIAICGGKIKNRSKVENQM